MTLKIAFLGDICLTGKFDLESNPKAYKQFEQIKPILENHDLVIANLESPLTEKTTSSVCKAIHIKSPVINVQLLNYLGINAVSLANNHTFDYGYEGYQSTCEALETAGIKYFGTQEKQIIIEQNNEKLLLAGYCCLSAHPSFANKQGVNTLNLPSFRNFLAEAKMQNCFPVASVHWGDENIHYPREDHVCFARLMTKEHTFLLHGHHPHVIQGLEHINDSLIAYSLGNFCTDEHTSLSVKDMVVKNTHENKETFLLSVTIKNRRIINYNSIPIKDTEQGLIFQQQPTQNRIELFSKSLNNSKEIYKRPSDSNRFHPSIDKLTPARFSFPWFARRLNYQFVGAFLKGLLNKIKYKINFSSISCK